MVKLRKESPRTRDPLVLAQWTAELARRQRIPPEWCDEASQDAFLRLWVRYRDASLSSLGSAGRPELTEELSRRFVAKVVRNAWADIVRGRARSRHVSEIAELFADDPESKSMDRSDALRAAFQSLTARERLIAELRYFQFKEHDEIAEQLRMKPDAVRKALERTRTKIAAFLGERGLTSGDF